MTPYKCKFYQNVVPHRWTDDGNIFFLIKTALKAPHRTSKWPWKVTLNEAKMRPRQFYSYVERSPIFSNTSKRLKCWNQDTSLKWEHWWKTIIYWREEGQKTRNFRYFVFEISISKAFKTQILFLFCTPCSYLKLQGDIAHHTYGHTDHTYGYTSSYL